MHHSTKCPQEAILAPQNDVVHPVSAMPPHVPLNTLLARQQSFSLHLWYLPVLAEGRSLQQMMAISSTALLAACKASTLLCIPLESPGPGWRLLLAAEDGNQQSSHSRCLWTCLSTMAPCVLQWEFLGSAAERSTLRCISAMASRAPSSAY